MYFLEKEVSFDFYEITDTIETNELLDLMITHDSV